MVSSRLSILVNYDYIDSTVSLLYATGTPEVDRLIGGFVALCELQFPERVRGYFLAGSYLDGTAVSASDLDIIVVFSETASGEELEAFWRMHYQVNLLSPVTFGAAPISESTLAKGVLAHLKETKVLYGEDVIKTFPSVSHEVALRRFISGSLKLLKSFHGVKEPLSLPLHFPDKDAAYYGFDFSSTVTPKGEKSVKRLVNLVARITASLLVLETNRQPESKRDCIAQYKEKVGGSWADFAEEVYLVLNQTWHYRMPQTPEDKRRLERLCQQLLEFENDYLEKVQPLVLAASDSEDTEQKTWGLECQKYVNFA